MTGSRPTVEVTTIIHAAREVVFDAWLTPRRLGAFLCAGDTHVSAVEVDARVDGEFRVVMSSDRGHHEHRGRYLEITRPARLRFTWISEATGGQETEVTVTFDAVDGGTRVVLVHRGLADAATVTRHQGGWASILKKCAAALERTDAAPASTTLSDR